MKKLFLLICLLGSVCSANTFEQKVERLHKGEIIKLTLKNGTVLKGTFEGYVPYDESLFILPLGKFGLFADDAYDLRQIKDITILKFKKL